MSFIPTQEILHIHLVSRLTDEKRGCERSIPIVLHEFSHQLRTNRRGLHDALDALPFLVGAVSPVFLESTEYSVTCLHDFYSFVRREIDPNAVRGFQEF